MLHTTPYADRAGLKVAQVLIDFVESRLLAGLSLGADDFWSGLSDLLREFTPRNQALLARRAELQTQIDAWLAARRDQPWDTAAWQDFLRDIGYIEPVPAPFTVETTEADPEIASIAGPQLVVPVMNARFALNAANARWGSLYDALYGTDALGLGDKPQGRGYDGARGVVAVAWAADFLDHAVPLAGARHAAALAYRIEGRTLLVDTADGVVGLQAPQALVAHKAGSILLRHNGLHIELHFDPADPIGALSASGLKDVVLESALTAIQDCEDSVAAVDAEDKVLAYGNWLGLMDGSLQESFDKGGRITTRKLNEDRVFTALDGSDYVLSGRALMLVRNVGHLMTSDAVLLDGQAVPEGLLDAMITVTAALHDLNRQSGPRNSRKGSVYVVKPKMHGPEEAAFADATYAFVERILALPHGTVKLGLMDEERRTSANLPACIKALKDRIVFINTGFLDRTGDEIHTVMQAGPVLPKADIRTAPWLNAYENGNVEAGLAAGMRNRGQIGKGMWAKPDAMAEMLATKIGHPKAGANTAWVPSPTAATLHATHYHQVDVASLQDQMLGRTTSDFDALMTPPLLGGRNLSAEQVQYEVDLNCQSILGYVVRWIDQGIGCSKVPDIDNVALMEDRATLRISSQFLANWLLHGLTSDAQIDDSLRRMAVAVDGQNAGDPAYVAMAPAYDGAAFLAARALILDGAAQPSGYTEPLLHAWRRKVKAA